MRLVLSLSSSRGTAVGKTRTTRTSPPHSSPQTITRTRRSRRQSWKTQVFTGIVEGKAEVASIVDKDEFRSLVLRFPSEEGRNYLERAQVGCSVAVNGTCLTVTTIAEERNELGFDVIGETLRRTNLGGLGVGDECNFERAARIGDEVGGHNVSGHVHTKAEVSEVEREGENNVRYQIRLPTREYVKYVLPKGYIAVDGISLTVGEVDDQEGTFNLYLIPETLRVTTLGAKTPGSAVNVEVDAQTQAIVDTVEKMRQRGDFFQ